MNNTVKVGDYVYLKNDSDFDFSKKYKVACIRINDIIVEYPTGWSPSMMDIDFNNLKPDKTYWYASKYIVCSHGLLIINNE